MNTTKRFLPALLFLLFFIPAAALAANHTVANGDTFDLSTCTSGDTVTINVGAAATLTGTAPSNVMVLCNPMVTLTLNGVSIDNSLSVGCSLSFTGTMNTLILAGNNILKSGGDYAGIAVEGLTELVIMGSGTLGVTGGMYAAGIGGSYDQATGTITLSGGTIIAQGGYRGAGIGGAYLRSGGKITVSGSTVTATGGYEAAGIGGGSHGGGGTIEVSSGTVTATGGTSAAGIGGGLNDNGGAVTLSGGMTYAKGGSGAPNDIGYGLGHSGMATTLTISQTAAVFLENNTSTAPSLPDGHVNKTPADPVDPMIFSGNTVYGLTVPAAWTGSDGGYFRLYTVIYDPNGGSGTPPDSPPVQHAGTSVTIEDGSSLKKNGSSYLGWNTLSNGNGTSYSAGSSLTLTSNITLYAMWSTATMPQTGDAFPAGIFAGLMILSLLGAVAVGKQGNRTLR